MKLSIVTPTFRRPDKLLLSLHQLAEARRLSGHQVEHLVVQDRDQSGNPQDGTEEVALKFGCRFIRNTGEEYGAWGAAASDLGARMATGDYIVVADDDNVYFPQCVQHWLESVGHGAYDIGTTSAHVLMKSPSGRWSSTTRLDTLPQSLPPKLGGIDMMCFCFRAEWAKNFKRYAGKVYASDWHWFSRMLSSGASYNHLNRIVGYRL